MSNHLPDNPENALLTPDGVASLLGVHRVTLAGWRVSGRGPRYLKLAGGHCVRYRQADVEAWLEQQARENTSQDPSSVPE
jgi:predicted DNA-binding transcriptional regulator AlpA